MKIKTFAQRQKAQYIYDTYFDANSEHLLDFNLFDTLLFYGAIQTERECDSLDKKFEQIGDNLWAEMKKFDESKLK